MTSSFDLSKHPIALVPSWRRTLGDKVRLSFAHYRYRPQTIEDQRERFTCQIRDVTPDWLMLQVSNLKPGYELALESIVLGRREVLHIPMIDFADSVISATLFRKRTNKFIGIDLVFFNSGRSFHGYGTKCLSEADWVTFMGLALLQNGPNRKPLVDTRWVGHRLVAGYAALRWSLNSSHYLKWPTLIGSTNLNPDT